MKRNGRLGHLFNLVFVLPNSVINTGCDKGFLNGEVEAQQNLQEI